MIEPHTQLHEIFNALNAKMPHLLKGMDPLGMGANAITVANEHTVRKILFSPKDEETKNRQALLEQEVRAMRAFQNHRIEDVEVPVLLTEPETINHEDFIAFYDMTRLHGKSFSYAPAIHESPTHHQKAYQSAGELLAHFHKGAEGLDLGKSIGTGGWHGYEVAAVPELGEAINKSLAAADIFLKQNLKAGNAHGDVNMGNILFRGEKTTGLIDFSFSGHAHNIYTDMWTLPRDFQDDFMEGYERIAGGQLKDVVDATKLSIWVSGYNEQRNPADYRALAEKNIKEILIRLEPSLRP